MKIFARFIAAGVAGSAAGVAAAQPVASYDFWGNLNAYQAGAPGLGMFGGGGFSSATVFGMATTVYSTMGTPGTATEAGLTLDPWSVLSSGTDYTMQMVISKDSPVSDSWLKVLDVSNLGSDSGLYYDPNDILDIYPNSESGPNVDYNTYYNIVLTVSGTTETLYLDGTAIHSDTSGTMDLGASDVFTFFADDAATGGQEYSDTTVSYIALYNTALNADQVERLPTKDQFTGVPGPAAALPFLLGLARRRRR